MQTPSGRLSWSRLCSLICLACAISLAWGKRSESLVNAFLWAAVGSYSSSKIGDVFKCNGGTR